MNNDDLVTIDQLARMLRIPIRWLRQETDADRLPHLDADGMTLFSLAAVRAALLRRAAKVPPRSPSRQGAPT